MIRSGKGAFMKKIPIRVLSFCMAISVTVSGCGRFNSSFGDSYKGSSTEAGKPDISVQKKFDQYVSDILKTKSQTMELIFTIRSKIRKTTESKIKKSL